MTKLDKNRILNYLEQVEKTGEHRYLVELFSELESHPEFSDFLKNDWNRFFDSDNNVTKDLSGVLNRLHKEIDTIEETKKLPITKRLISTYSKIASVLLIPVIIAGVYFYSKTPEDVTIAQQTPEIEIVAPENARVKYVLPDSSVVCLNSGSSLKYKDNFAVNRKVELKGKAYFEVTHRSNAKFSVVFNNGIIEVLGTRFSISEKGNGNFNVVLAEGKVRALIGKERLPVILSPDQILKVKGSHHIVSNINAENAVAWKEGKLIFRNTPLKDIAEQLSDFYNADVKIDDKDLQNLTYRGTFKDESLEDVLQLMKLTLPVKSRIIPPRKLTNGEFTKKQVIISSNK
jgi:ferric-dicitrate binding protein FerR (iron transport regulator)